ncbi:hypothetical protein CON48_15020 [Bacillus thuringiensis]|uniref:Uncharacterized protein n=2 Tax=Bacillus cereus group TaxID=86661 RepID=A0A9X7PBF2_BACTU|nr:hypothetical protein DOS87_30200 [Bacillus sp. CR71]AXR25821.1 hypothetical protein DPQ26_30215 [Bacillus sp. E25]KAA0801295.1 hypothetical protein DN406_03820 [Bacillus sp. BB56-3]KAA6457780.1 hypothetical protein DX932_22735 [Bacillus cereus]KAA8484612.1 hypothetical protein FYW98_23640 [Bacillus thuringiensis]OTX74696.1 hypothetical protein BK719_09215 [Bacillus thuringiensis serovar novosibirsk]OTY39520.1 hypothetical protein BK736_15790 [Bacillus thuringiensis serovar poloniensis]OTZ
MTFPPFYSKVGLGKNTLPESKIHSFSMEVNSKFVNFLKNITIKVTLSLSFVTPILFAYTVKYQGFVEIEGDCL